MHIISSLISIVNNILIENYQVKVGGMILGRTFGQANRNDKFNSIRKLIARDG